MQILQNSCSAELCKVVGQVFEVFWQWVLEVGQASSLGWRSSLFELSLGESVLIGRHDSSAKRVGLGFLG